MDVARLNATHGARAERRASIERLRGVDDSVPIVLDLQGPEVRTTAIEPTRGLDTGDHIHLDPDDEAVEAGDVIGVCTPLSAVTPGDTVLLDDGHVETVVEAVQGDRVTVEVTRGGTISGRVGINVPGVDLGLDPVTAADQNELELVADPGVDYVAASFVRDREDMDAVSSAIAVHDPDTPLIAKVEHATAIDNIGEIIEAADGLMVARGDLGVECPLEQVPILQKRLVSECRQAGTPVIIATEMLESMIDRSRPTRAEATDVANAVIEGADAVMLSGETAVGADPAGTTATMARIVSETEASAEYREYREDHVPPAGPGQREALARSARYLARDVDATIIVVATASQGTVREVAKFRPSVPIIAVVPSTALARTVSLSYGVQARTNAESLGTIGDVSGYATAIGREEAAGDNGMAVVIGDMDTWPGGDSGSTVLTVVGKPEPATGAMDG